MKGITPFLWFDHQAEEAANFYVSIFKNSKIVTVSRYGDAGPGPKGTVMLVKFQLDGQDFVALNGNKQFPFTLATSFVVNCENQKEVDHFWEKLGQGGTTRECGWLQDRYGISWQITPIRLMELINDKDPQKSARVFGAMLQMTKIDIQTLEDAAALSSTR